MSRQSFTYLVSGDNDRPLGNNGRIMSVNTLFQQTTTVIPLWWASRKLFFDIRKGRVMDNYQLIYITQGRGWFHVTPEKRVALSGGSMLIIPPYTWHSYYPDKKTGWQEYWIGIRGAHIDSRYESGFFSLPEGST